MTLFDFVQAAIIGAVVLVSALYVLRRLLPKWMHARQASLAATLNQPYRSAVLRGMGKFLTPGETSGGGCGSGCSTCATCESNPEVNAAVSVKPMEFHRNIH